ncbi:MAG TPA: efflux RND transporter permease subunit [Burkholderiales bacterium]|nr:efflux RND transporter permease subunit [Burkholderiales bacterium]
MASLDDLGNLPLANGSASADRNGHPLLSDVAALHFGTTLGEVDRYNMQRVVSFAASSEGVALGDAVRALRTAITRAGDPPKGVTVALRGQIPAFEDTLDGLRVGLLLAAVVILLLLTANFQSLRLAVAVLTPVPAVIVGVLAALAATRSTLNVQSYMGAIMALGISVANAILLVSYAEQQRRDGASVVDSIRDAAAQRLRPILMTASAMIAGMVPMGIGTGEGGLTGPLGRAVIGGLLFATFATLLILPAVYVGLQGRTRSRSASLNPDNPMSAHHASL